MPSLRHSLLLAVLGLVALGGCKKNEDKTKTSGLKGVESTTPSGKNPTVVIKTSLGNITVELFADKAPITVKNFLKYADDKFFDNTIFHRVMVSFMIQGGGFTPDLKKKPTREAIQNEAENGLRNTVGTLAMARTNDIHSATAQFFINVEDNAALDHQGPDHFGYAVFGKVTKGMKVVNKIRRTPVAFKPPMFQHLPKTPVLILSVRRVK